MNGNKRGSRLPRSAGTVLPQDLLKNRVRGPSTDAIAADMEALNKGQSRTVACLFRGTYGQYPKRFRQQMLDLLPGVPVVRPFWYAIRRERFRIEEPITSAHVRSRDPKTDRNVRATGIYATGKPLSWAGFVVVHCRTSLGVIDFAVPRPDVPLILHYFNDIMQK